MQHENLFTEKNACRLCSTSTVQRRVERGEQADHAKRHIAQGDPVVVRKLSGDCLIEVAEKGER